jgi:hypothetical protein
MHQQQESTKQWRNCRDNDGMPTTSHKTMEKLQGQQFDVTLFLQQKVVHRTILFPL